MYTKVIFPKMFLAVLKLLSELALSSELGRELQSSMARLLQNPALGLLRAVNLNTFHS